MRQGRFCTGSVLGRVGLGFQPKPSRRQVQKTQAPLRVFVVASGHAAPWFEFVEAPFHGLARRVPFRVVGLGVQASAPGRKDGLDVPWHPPGAEAVVVLGSVRDQAGQGRVAVFPQGPGLGAVGARAARHAQVPGTALAIRQAVDRGAEAAPAAAPRGIRLLLLGRARRAHGRAPDRAVQPHGGHIRLGLQVGPQARPDALVAPGRLTAVDRVPFSVRGRPRAPRCAPPCHPAQRFHAKTAMRVLAYA